MRASSGWIGVDLDGTLAHYEGWDCGKVGPPIPLMVERVKAWLAQGVKVKIVTARVAAGPEVRVVEEQQRIIQDWCQQHIGQRLEVTCRKDYAMIQLWDDRCVQVEPNTGKTMIDAQDEVYRENLAERDAEIKELRAGLVTQYPYPNEESIAVKWNLHPDEAGPRGETWLHERKNWESEIAELRATVAAMEKTIMATHLFDEHEELYVMKWTQDRIRIEREIAAWTPEKKAAMDEFIEKAPTMTFDELDAVIGAFGDPEGTYCQQSEAGKQAIGRWTTLFNEQSEERREKRLDEIRARRNEEHTQRNLDRLTDGSGSGVMK